MHCVFRNIDTNEYVWWVFDRNDELYLDTFPTIEFPTYDSMLEHTINDYYKLWRLVD
jgi:hypothetical protein